MISLDVFDTALFRDVYKPTDIFTLVEEKVGKNFAALRKEAENKASKLQRFYTYQDIYKYLGGFDPKIEVETELEHVYANPKILEMYNENPSNFVFISDMYLPATTIKKMLLDCGYKNPRVFVSCEEKCCKGSGILFEKVQKRLGKKIDAHYGDNYRSDIEGAVKQGIKPMFEAALHNMPLNLPAVHSPLLKKYAAELEVSDEDSIILLAKWYAPLIYNFTKWVLAQRKPGQRIFFLSRDMYLPYLISTKILKEDNIKYLHCSRRSLAPLFIASGVSQLVNKMKSILTPEEYKSKLDTTESLKYLQSAGIRNGDIIVDIGYSGSTQSIIERYLGVKMRGLYVQLDQALNKVMDMEMYLTRYALMYRFLVEFIFTSPEDCIEDYKDGKVLTVPDSEKRKQYANRIVDTIIDKDLYDRIDKMNLSIFDIEQTLIHIQNYPSYEMMLLFNEPILTNREKIERGINFDKKEILKGNLQECYRKSYARPLFKKLLELDPELSCLSSLLP